MTGSDMKPRASFHTLFKTNAELYMWEIPETYYVNRLRMGTSDSYIIIKKEVMLAYHRPRSTAVQVAKIISFTVIAVSVVLGCFILASAYVTANSSCKQLEQELEFLAETADRMQPLRPEALVQEEPQESRDLSKLEQKIKDIDDVSDNKIANEKPEVAAAPVDSSSSSSSEESDEDDEKTIHIKMPLELDFDDLAGALMEKNQRSRMNCIVEKKRAEQMVDHQPKTIQLPFGLNLTTDPRFEHVSGERMAIFCESGNDQSHQEPSEPEEQEETIMIQPIMIPIPHTNFETHMPMQVQPQVMSNNIPNVPNRIPMEPRQPPMPIPHPMETMRPPMPVPMMQQQEQQSSEPDFPPVQMLHRIAQQIIAQRLQMEQANRNQEDGQSNEVSQPDEDQQEHQHYPRPDFVMAHRIPIPEEVLSQINRLPHSDMIVAVSGQEQDDQSQEQPEMQQQQQAVDANEHAMNVRIGYGRQMPEHMPLHMVQIQQEPQPVADEMRPHYVHPRSVRSVDGLLPKKRVKRCSCDCAC